MYSYFRCDNASFIDYQAIKDSWKSTTLSNIKEFVLSNDWIFSIFFDQSCVISIIRAISFIGVFWQKINCSPFALLAHLLGGWGDEEAKQTGRIKSNSLPINFCQLFKSSLSNWASLKLLFCLLNWFNVMKPMVPLSQMILVMIE